MDTISESTVRCRARRLGYVVKKSRRKRPSQWDRGGYTLIHIDTWIAAVGPYFDADLQEIADFLSDGDEGRVTR